MAENSEQPQARSGGDNKNIPSNLTLIEQPWRKEPEIDSTRQRFLSERRSIIPDPEHGIYPFKGIELSRADVEWLLATHCSGNFIGPVDWTDINQRDREGIDLRGAILQKADLRELPLARIIGGYSTTDFTDFSAELLDLAAVHLEGASLHRTHLEGAFLREARLEGAALIGAHLQHAALLGTHLDRADLQGANLAGANMFTTYIDYQTGIDNIILGNEIDGSVYLDNVHWGGTNFIVVDWSQKIGKSAHNRDGIFILGDEQKAWKQIEDTGLKKERSQRIQEFKIAVRATRQLSASLQSQGLNEDGDRFALRAQILQTQLYRFQKEYFRFIGSLILNWISGYGYRPIRSLITYLLAIVGFTVLYFSLRQNVHPELSLLDSFVFSITSFHGRGFSPGETLTLHNPLTIFAAFEAVIGLIIEITFIATFTQRFFAR
jgi:uncharacterized protein YjbI with pentapeptide repeats